MVYYCIYHHACNNISDVKRHLMLECDFSVSGNEFLSDDSSSNEFSDGDDEEEGTMVLPRRDYVQAALVCLEHIDNATETEVVDFNKFIQNLFDHISEEYRHSDPDLWMELRAAVDSKVAMTKSATKLDYKKN